MAKKTEATPDYACINTWQSLLSEFHALSEKDTKKLDALKEKAQATPTLTFRQLQGILARCDNKLNGTYGNGGKSDYEANSYDKKRMENKGIA